MKTPTIEEVKEYFKDAKEVRCFGNNKIYDISNWIIYDYHNSDSCVNVYKSKSLTQDDFAWVYSQSKGYAEIISYKTKTFTVDETFIKEAYESACPTWKTKIKDRFSDAFKSELEVGKWYTPLNNYECKALFLVVNSKNKLNVGYGVDWTGKWVDVYDISSGQECRLATEEEVKTALVKEAEKRGFNRSFKYKSLGGINYDVTKVYGFELEFNNNKLVLVSNSYGTIEHFKGKNDIFDNGTWAEIIKETEVSLTDLIECYKKNNNIDNLKVV